MLFFLIYTDIISSSIVKNIWHIILQNVSSLWISGLWSGLEVNWWGGNIGMANHEKKNWFSVNCISFAFMRSKTWAKNGMKKNFSLV